MIFLAIAAAAVTSLAAASASAPTPEPTPLRGSYGSVGFEVVVLQNTSYGISSVSCGDINGDGKEDIAIAVSNSGTVGWYQNRGNEVFGELQTVVANVAMGFSEVTVADMDGDGFLDLVAAATSKKRLYWWRNTAGDGSAWQSYLLDSSVQGIASVAAADLNGDGHLDLVRLLELTSHNKKLCCGLFGRSLEDTVHLTWLF
jgi:hypothetical protein